MTRRYSNYQYILLGEQITRLNRTLVAVNDLTMRDTMNYVGEQTGYSRDTVYRWQQGRSRPSTETVEILAQIGKKDASLPREWGESFLKAARHPDATSIVNNLWGPKEIHSIPCNLPSPEHTEFIGRQAEMDRLIELLFPRYAAHLITVDGIGGVGKTALVLEVAHLCWRASTGEAGNSKIPIFEAIIFVSAKQQYLTPDGILPRYEGQRTLRDIFHEVARTLEQFEITHVPPQDQSTRVRDALARRHTLLIVDNLETMENRQDVISFLYDLPPSVKVVITTRERSLYSPVRLEQLTEEESLNLVGKEVQEKGVDVSRKQTQALYQRIGGIPAALVYAVGQIASGYSVETVLDRVPKANSDVARFCFEGSVGPLRGQPAHSLLMALAIFPKHSLRAALAHTAGLASDPIAVEEGLALLRRLSLVSQQEERYGILPLTREYALAELALHPSFEQEARKRWVSWYLTFTKEYGGRDWSEWHIQFDRIEEEWENLLAVFDWCASHEQYHAIRSFWQAGGVHWVAYIYGFWDARLTWLTWLIEEAERYGDWPTSVEALMEKGYMLNILGQLDDADEFLMRAWDFHEYADSRVQIKVAENIGRLRIYQKQYADAFCWLDRARSLLDIALLDEPEYTRRWANMQNYLGRIYFEMRDYSKAKSIFREVLERTQAIGFQRALIYAQKYLADIAIADGRYNEAELLLQAGLVVSIRNKDKRRVAYHKGSFAHLHKEQGNMEEALRYAQEALSGFERLGMQLEAEEMRELLQLLKN